TNRQRPPLATMLYGVEIPSAGGGTSVANSRAAYAALPEDERRRLDTLRTFNSLDSDHADTRPEDREKYGKPIAHPMARTHPVHGSRAVYFHISKATHIDGMTPEASRSYMKDLLARMIRPEIVYHHVWTKGDVLVIDNRATMHRAHGDYDRSQSRVPWRVIARGSLRPTPVPTRLPFAPPLAPMLSKAADALPGGDGWQFEPKWDGFRTIVFRDGDEVLLQSRDEKPMNRYFPELVPPLVAALPDRVIVDGEIVIVGATGLDFEALLLRI